MLTHFSVFQPNSWDNSIAPINLIHKLENEINTIIDEVNSIEDTIFQRSKEYTDEQIAIIDGRLENITTQINQMVVSINALSSRVTFIDERESRHYENVVTRIINLTNYVQSVRLELKNYTDMQVLALKTQLEAEINAIKALIDSLLDMTTIDGHTGQYATVRKIIGTWGVAKNKYIGGNRYALSWGQLSQNTNNGWLARYSNRIYGRINYFAPTWHNLMLNNYNFGTGSSLYNNNLNTWGCFCNLTMLYIADLVHKINQYCASSTSEVANNYKMVDVYDKTEWDAYVANGAVKPTYSETDVTELYDGTNTHVSLIVSQFKLSIGIFTGSVGGYGLYASGTTVNALFNGSSDLPALIQLLQGNLNNPAYSNTFFFF